MVVEPRDTRLIVHAEDRGLHLLVAEDLQNLLQVPRGHRQQHPLLALADPYLPRRHPLGLQRYPVEVHLDAEPVLVRGLADPAAEATASDVRYPGTEFLVADLLHRPLDLLLLDGVRDLHRWPAHLLALLRELSRREGDPVDAVEPSPSAGEHDVVAGLHVPDVLVLGEHPQAAAVHHDVPRVVLVEHRGPVHRRDAHAVPVAPYAVHDAPEQVERMLHTLRQLLVRIVQGPEAEHVRVRYRVRPDTHDVPDDAAQPSRRTSERLDRRRVVMGLHLDGHRHVVRQIHDACVVLEDAETPVRLQIIYKPPEVCLQQPVHGALGGVDHSPERLVAAVFRHGLVECLELDVRRPPLPDYVVVGDVSELLNRQPQPQRLGYPPEFLVRGVEKINFVVVEGMPRLGDPAHHASLSSYL